MRVKFWGTRGSIPVPGRNMVKYGGNTPCIEVITGEENRIIILDAGTGIRDLGNYLIKEKRGIISKIDILITHTHFDHIQGLPFFAPFYNENYDINIYACLDNQTRTEYIIDSQMQPFFFPVTRDVFKANLGFFKIERNSTIEIAGIKIQSADVNHSKGTVSYKLSESGKSIVYMTDNEILFNELSREPEINQIEQLNSGILKFCMETDYLIHDCMYNKYSFSEKLGWGHSNNIALAYFAILSRVKNLVLFHYDPDYSDEIVEEMYQETKDIISGIKCISSFEGLEISC